MPNAANGGSGAVLVETVFISNPAEAAKLRSPAFLNAAASLAPSP
jgi:N-acetylmuramoyl-L-alanine amidase